MPGLTLPTCLCFSGKKRKKTFIWPNILALAIVSGPPIFLVPKTLTWSPPEYLYHTRERCPSDCQDNQRQKCIGLLYYQRCEGTTSPTNVNIWGGSLGGPVSQVSKYQAKSSRGNDVKRFLMLRTRLCICKGMADRKHKILEFLICSYIPGQRKLCKRSWFPSKVVKVETSTEEN